MVRAVVFLLLIVAVATIDAAPNCGQNEYFNSCGSSCQPTCQNPTPQICTLACVAGCECTDGYVRNAENRCIPAYNC
ncbi:PREDICTED: chymotrypsin inhibitor-like [Acromyrmex echinatior]|uniref:chymotrypsin inhibitor-like n=1 Tax=Acromyrmex echinatior TaxID=103372 RepID=UPI000580C454|nr:PREDICTED: chymotrypsin inhibitor-like [Acromyrmex echinatior]